MRLSKPAGFFLDTTILVAAERGRLDLDAVLNEHPEHDFAISTVTAAEICAGVERACGSMRQKHEDFAERQFATFAAIDFTMPDARLWADLSAQLARKGTPIGALDLMIAATALCHDYGVITLNEDEFRRVPGLYVHVPAIDT